MQGRAKISKPPRQHAGNGTLAVKGSSLECFLAKFCGLALLRSSSLQWWCPLSPAYYCVRTMSSQVILDLDEHRVAYGAVARYVPHLLANQYRSSPNSTILQ